MAEFDSVPAAHAVQLRTCAFVLEAAELDPGLQNTHVPSDLKYFPAEHVQVVSPGPEFAVPEGHAMQTACPEAVLYVP